MIITEIYNGQGLGNQLFCYVTTRVIALDKGFDFGIQSAQKLKCLEFMKLDIGKKVVGGTGNEGATPRTLPKGIEHYYNERKIGHPSSGADIRTFDPDLIDIPDNTKIDGIMQDEHYILHRRDEIREWLAVKPEFECNDYSSDDICVINFRGGEYVGNTDLFLTQKYWDDAVAHMLKKNPHFRFVVITDDVKTAKKFFPNFDVLHFDIAKDYVIIKNAHYLILSNSSFAWFPAWLSTKLKYCIAPKYWARHNVGDGFWSCSYNITSGWDYLDKDGQLFSYKTCLKELNETIKSNPDIFEQKKITNSLVVVSNYYNDLSWVPRYTDNYLIYDQSDAAIYPPKLDRKKVVKSEHLGHNVRDYCNYIIDHYDTLPDRVLLCAGNVIPRHISREVFDKLANNAYFTPFEDVTKHKEEWPSAFFSSDGGYCEKNTDWYLRHTHAHPTKYFNSYNDFLRLCYKNPVLPRYIRFTTGANFIVPKEQILKLPKVFYDNLRRFVSHSKTAIPGESYILERAYYTLWTSNFELNEVMCRPLPADFAAKPVEKPTLIVRASEYMEYKYYRAKRFVRRGLSYVHYKLNQNS